MTKTFEGKVCSVPGCGRRLKRSTRAGLCDSHLMRLHRHGDIQADVPIGARNHGLSGRKHPLYSTWLMMRARCNTPSASGYAYYGGRGIRVCERWDSFEAFAADVGERPSPEHTLDRKDPNGDYEPGNCRWATRLEQRHNRRDSRHAAQA